MIRFVFITRCHSLAITSSMFQGKNKRNSPASYLTQIGCVGEGNGVKCGKEFFPILLSHKTIVCCFVTFIALQHILIYIFVVLLMQGNAQENFIINPFIPSIINCGRI